MKFGEKLRLKRNERRLTQEELASKLGLSKRTVEGYEAGSFYPRRRSTYDRLAEIFGTDRNWFLTEDEDTDVAESQSSLSRAEEAVKTVKALYAGAELSDEDKDALAKALMEAYFIARRNLQGK